MLDSLFVSVLGRGHDFYIECNIVVHVLWHELGNVPDIVQKVARCMSLRGEPGRERLGGKSPRRQRPGQCPEGHVVGHGPEPGGVLSSTEVYLFPELVMDVMRQSVCHMNRIGIT